MTESDDWRDSVIPKVADETDHIIRSFSGAPRGGKEIKVVTADGGIGHMYAEGEILVREEHLDRVLEILEPGADRDQVRTILPESGASSRVSCYSPLANRSPKRSTRLDAIDQQLGRGVATPNHVLTVATGRRRLPCHRAQESTTTSSPSHRSITTAAGTGCSSTWPTPGCCGIRRRIPWLAGRPDGEPGRGRGPESTSGRTAADSALRRARHVRRGRAPLHRARDRRSSWRTPSRSRAARWSRTWSQARTRRSACGVDIFHLTITCSTRNDLPLIAFQEWLRKAAHSTRARFASPRPATAASTGSRPGLPRSPDVIAVGALGGDWRSRATFSNFGPWVDVYAPGRDLVNAFATGTYTCHVYPYADQAGSSTAWRSGAARRSRRRS